jgi:hypothetical protein
MRTRAYASKHAVGTGGGAIIAYQRDGLHKAQEILRRHLMNDSQQQAAILAAQELCQSQPHTREQFSNT